MVEYHRFGPPTALPAPHHKPLPTAAKGPIAQYQQEAQFQQSPQAYPLRPSPSQSPRINDFHLASSISHSRTRTSSSQIFPNPTSSPSPSYNSTNRSSSTQTSSTNGFSSNQPTPTMASTQYQYHIHRSGTNNSTNSTGPRRSTSSRSSTLLAPTSYVALMRKQKATVWCDRSQTLDPRTAAAQKAAKHRAALEIHGAGSNRTSTLASSGGKVRSTKASTYVPANLSGVSVPVRLSANEMLGDEEEGAQDGRSIGDNASTRIHNRTGSGRSSVHSGKYPSGYSRSNQPGGGGAGGGRFSATSTPPSGNEDISPSDSTDNPEETPVPFGHHHHHQLDNYFSSSSSTTAAAAEVGKTGGGAVSTPGSSGSGSEGQFGEAGELRSPNKQSSVAMAAEQARRAEELRRRGSVDERTMTMGGKGRLFVANPDLDD